MLLFAVMRIGVGGKRFLLYTLVGSSHRNEIICITLFASLTATKSVIETLDNSEKIHLAILHADKSSPGGNLFRKNPVNKKEELGAICDSISCRRPC